MFFFRWSGGGQHSQLRYLHTKVTWTHLSRFSHMFFGFPLDCIRKLTKKVSFYIQYFEHPDMIKTIKLLSALPGRIWYCGDFYDERYFKHLRSQLQQEFRLKSKLNHHDRALMKKIQSCASVAIYLPSGLKKTDAATLAHYQKAIQYMCTRVEQLHIFLFGENIFNLNSSICTVILPKKKRHEAIHLQLLKQCRHHIVTESTLSWWGAWLSEYDDKIVIVPQKWSSNYVKEYPLPATWITLDKIDNADLNC